MEDYNFTERTRKVLAIALRTANEHKCQYVCTEHVLLGLMEEGEGFAVAVLQRFGCNLNELGLRIQETLRLGQAKAPMEKPVYSSRAKKVFEFAQSECQELGQGDLGTEYLLLGLLREERGRAAKILVEFGITFEKVRAALLQIQWSV